MDSIESNLKEICRHKGLSLTDVANRMGTSPSNLLSSVKGNPTISKIQDIADALQVSVSELLTMRPERAMGVAYIGGVPFQLSKPVSTIVQIPQYVRYDELRDDVSKYIQDVICGEAPDSIMAMLETFEVFCLIYDSEHEIFHLSCCFADGRTVTLKYDKLEFCSWKEIDGKDISVWDVKDLTSTILIDIENEVPSKLQTL